MPTYYLSANRNSAQENPFLLQLQNGNILGLWTDLYPDPGVGGTFGVYGRAWRGDLGAASVSDVRINTLTDDIQRDPSATSFGNGRFAVIFESRGASAINGQDDAWYDTYIRFYNADGSAMGAARQLTPNTTDDHYAADITTLANGQSITLVARYEGAGDYDLLAYRHNAAGQQIGGPVRLVDDAGVYVSGLTGAAYISPSIAAGANGNYAVAWHATSNLGPNQVGYSVFTQVFRPDGSAVGPPRVLGPVWPDADASLGLDQTGAQLAARSAGGFALAWNREEQDVGGGSDVYLRLLNADGVATTPQVMVNTDRQAGEQVLQDVVDLGAGRVLVTYFNQIPDAIDDTFDGGQLLGRVFNAAGQALTSSFLISEGAPLEDMGGGNTLINADGRIVSTFSAELSYQFDDDVLIVMRDLTLPVFRGTAGHDGIVGTHVNDQIEGGAGHDFIMGNRGNDRLNGGLGNDTLQGGPGRDTLEGHDGNDRLFGGAGADLLLGNRGNDTLTGDQGADVFVFSRSSGQDVVTDFQNGADRLQLVDHTAQQVRALIANAREVAGDTILNLGPQSSVRLNDTSRGEIDLSDFIF